MFKMIEKGLCYADDTPADQMKVERDAGIESRYKEMPIEFHAEKFQQMIDGDEKAKGFCI